MEYIFADEESRLPPAYHEVENLFREAALLRQNLRHAQDQWYANGPVGDYRQSSGAQALLAHYYEHSAKTFETFALIFEEEAKAGRFEIAEVPGFLFFAADPRNTPFFSLFRRSEVAFEATLAYARISTKNISSFLSCFSEILETSRVDKLWDVFKMVNAISEPNETEGWKFKGQNFTPPLLKERDSLGQIYMAALTRFFACPNISEETLMAIYLLIDDETAIGALSIPFNVKPEEGSRYGLEIDLKPEDFRSRYPAAFAERVKSAGVDPRVVEVLVSSWEGDCHSLFEAAKTLSAD